MNAPSGLCECGCGKLAPICGYTMRTQGYVKGEPLRFIRGHQNHGKRWTPERRATFVSAMTGHPVSDETKRKISDKHKASGLRPPLEACGKGARGKFREKSSSWRGGTTVYPNGYRLVYRPEHPRAHPNGYVYEHILVAEATLGRHLSKGEVVHHIDHVRLNNDPSNLMVFAKHADHLRFERAAQRTISDRLS